jgi:tripartite-type tricarboxylate transporter receptor subunit TctC
MRAIAFAARTAAAAFLSLFCLTALAAYPERPITLIVPWGAGGGTDATARIIGSLLEKELGQPVTVVNRTGGSGVGRPPGDRLQPARRLHDRHDHRRDRDDALGRPHDAERRDFTPIGVVNADPAGINVRADAPYKSVKDLLAAVKANPGKFKASGTGQGGIWHLALAGLLKDQGLDPGSVPWVPSNGAAPGLQDLVSGGVEVVPCSIPEARSLIDAGKVKALAIMDANPPALYPNLATLKKELNSNWTMAAWRAIAAPKGLPADIQAKLVASLKKVYDSKEYREFMAARGFGVIWQGPEDAGKFMAKSDQDLGAVMKSVGIAK